MELPAAEASGLLPTPELAAGRPVLTSRAAAREATGRTQAAVVGTAAAAVEAAVAEAADDHAPDRRSAPETKKPPVSSWFLKWPGPGIEPATFRF